MERAMKVQDVMLQAMAKKITWWQAAEFLGISDRHMRRWRERFVEEGYNGLLDRRRGQAVICQDVVHSIGTREADCDEQSGFRGKTESTSIRMPDSPSAVERLGPRQ